MTQFLFVVNRALIIGYIVCILPLLAGFVINRSFPIVSRAPWARAIEQDRQNVLAKSKTMALNLLMPTDFTPQAIDRNVQKSSNTAIMQHTIRLLFLLIDLTAGFR